MNFLELFGSKTIYLAGWALRGSLTIGALPYATDIRMRDRCDKWVTTWVYGVAQNVRGLVIGAFLLVRRIVSFSPFIYSAPVLQ